jgi:hypothetical protein
VAASGGVATFSDLSLADAGNYTLSATDGSLFEGTSDPFAIAGAFGAPAMLVVASQPTDTTAKAVISPAVAVEVEDASGNLVVSDTSSVTLQIAAGPTGGVLSGTLTEPVINGVATFGDLSSLTSGTYVLTATDGVLPAVATNSFLISPGDAAQLNLVNPPSDLAGGPSTVQAGVEDQYGNLVTGYDDPVTLNVSGPAGTTIAPVTVSAVNGLATFTIDAGTPGSYSFTIDSGSFSTSTASNPITLTYTQPTLIFSSPIDTIVAGQRIAPITLTLYNASGVITNSRPHVTLGILSGPGGGRIFGGVHAVGRNGQVALKAASGPAAREPADHEART